MKHRESLRRRQGKPTEGKKRYLAHHTLAELKPTRDRIFTPPSAQVVRMFESLSSNGWQFTFTVKAKSPRGFSYAAEGATPINAFLNAFGLWRKQAAALVPKAPAVVAEVRCSPVRAPVSKKQEAYLSELVHELLRDVAVAA